MDTDATPIKVVYCYATADEDLCINLDKHLSILKSQGVITTWRKGLATAGTDWAEDIAAHLNSASVILLLISANFLESPSCYGTEMQRALEQHEARKTHVIPILLRPADWQNAPFGKLKPLPDNGKSITQWSNRDAAFANVAQGIRVALEDIQHQATSVPLTTFPYICKIPHRRNTWFTGREEELRQLVEALKTDQPLAISGLGGIGKTQLALEYAYRHRDKYRYIFWVSADTRNTINAEYSKIAELLDLPVKKLAEQHHIIEAVKIWLSKNRDWLLILDNADDLELFVDSTDSTKPSSSFLPIVAPGHILLTTRVHSVGRLFERIEIKQLTKDESLHFLLRRSGNIKKREESENVAPKEYEAAKIIIYELDGLPLALDQAGAYIEETSCGLHGYIKLYQKQHKELLRMRGSLAIDHPEPVATTFQLSFERIEKADPAAADLLRLCAFLAPDNISEAIIVEGAAELTGLLKKIARHPLKLNAAIATLQKYSLISRNPISQTLTVHRLVQVILRDTLTKNLEQAWAIRTVRTISRVFPQYDITDRIINWELCRQLLPHAQVCATWIEHWQINTTEGAYLLKSAGAYLQSQAEYNRAQSYFEKALAISRASLGNEHVDTTTHLNYLANVYWFQGKYEKAEAFCQQALTILQRLWGKEDSDSPSNMSIMAHMAHTLACLAIIYESQGKYEEAFKLQQQILITWQKILGEEHPVTAQSLLSLANVYHSQGKYEEALKCNQQALAIWQKILGEEHPVTAQSLHNLANIYHSQGKYEEALKCYQQALAIRQKILGGEHPDTAFSLDGVAHVYFSQKKYEEASKYYQQALSILQTVLGEEHPETAKSLSSLAGVYRYQEKFEEAELLQQQTLAIRQKVLGSAHPDIVNSLGGLANVYNSQGRHEEAIALHQQALTSQQIMLGNTHPSTAGSLYNLANSYHTQGKLDEAATLHQQALAIRCEYLGEKHPDTVSSMNNLANVYEEQGKYEEAANLHQQALAIRKSQGQDHSDIAASMSNLANVYDKQGKYEEATNLHQQALAIRRSVLGIGHRDTANSLNNIASVYYHQKKYADAELVLKQALSIQQEALGEMHAETALTLNNLGELYAVQGRDEEAEIFHRRALSVRQVLGDKYPDLVESLHNLAVTYGRQGRYEEALPLFEQAQTILKERLSSEHPVTKDLQRKYERTMMMQRMKAQRYE